MTIQLSAVSAFIRLHRLRLLAYGVLFLLALGSLGGILYIRHKANADFAAYASRQAAVQKQATYLKKYEEFRLSLSSYAEKGIDISTYSDQESAVKASILGDNYAAADTGMQTITASLDTAAATLAVQQAEEAAKAAEAKKVADAAAELARQQEEDKADLSGTVSDAGKAVAGAVVTITMAPDFKADATTGSDGKYSFRVTAGSYSMAVSKSGYTTATTAIELAVKQVLAKDIALVKPAPTPTPTPRPTATPKPTPNPTATPAPISQSNGSGSYELRSISTSRGTFSISLLTIDLNHSRVITDAASDSDCTNGCATKSLQTYINDDHGYAGMNGTYFCPPDYADCSGKTNSFYWKLWDSPSGHEINTNNTLGEQDPFLAFSYDGTPRYFSTWQAFHTSGYSAYAGISCKPRMVENGNNVLSNADMDSKQISTKSNRGGIGVKGQTLYAVIAKSATVPDLAAIMMALGVDYAINLDGGGSSAMAFNGSYKVGPGRALPNAIIFQAR